MPDYGPEDHRWWEQLEAWVDEAPLRSRLRAFGHSWRPRFSVSSWMLGVVVGMLLGISLGTAHAAGADAQVRADVTYGLSSGGAVLFHRLVQLVVAYIVLTVWWPYVRRAWRLRKGLVGWLRARWEDRRHVEVRPQTGAIPNPVERLRNREPVIPKGPQRGQLLWRFVRYAAVLFAGYLLGLSAGSLAHDKPGLIVCAVIGAVALLLVFRQGAKSQSHAAADAISAALSSATATAANVNSITVAGGYVVQGEAPTVGPGWETLPAYRVVDADRGVVEFSDGYRMLVGADMVDHVSEVWAMRHDVDRAFTSQRREVLSGEVVER